MGHTEAYSTISDDLYKVRVDPYSDPRANVEIRDKKQLYGSVYPAPCGYACVAVVVRNPQTQWLELVGYAFPRDNYP